MHASLALPCRASEVLWDECKFMCLYVYSQHLFLPMHGIHYHITLLQATQGEVALENVHPFSRELWGIQWCFAHNGECPQFTNLTAEDTPMLGKTTQANRCYHAVGDTDSEAVFCAILNALKAEFPQGLPTLSVLHEFLSYICEAIIQNHATETIFNFLLGCGQYTLFAYSWPGKRPGSKVWNGLHYIVRQPPFSTAKLLDVDFEIDFATVTNATDRVAVIATKPLTEEAGWTEFKRGELIMFDKGLPYRTATCCAFAENEGRGLTSKYIKSKCTLSPTYTVRKCSPASPPRLVITPAAHTNGTCQQQQQQPPPPPPSFLTEQQAQNPAVEETLQAWKLWADKKKLVCKST
jgi:predicted glutamine amidotransferase